MLLLLLLLLLAPCTLSAQPVMNPNDSLMKGLVNWWITTPHQMGGNTWYPRVGKDRGTLANMTLAGTASGWQSSSRRFASGEMRFDGNDDQVNTGTTTLVANLDAFTVCLWFRSTGSGTQQLYTENVGAWPDMMLVLNWGGTPGTTMAFNNYDAVGGLEVYVDPLPVLSNSGFWYHACGVQRSKSSGELWFNGVLIGTNIGSVGTVAPTQRTLSGTPQGTNRLTGALDDIRVYNRALSPDEIGKLFVNQPRMAGPSMSFMAAVSLKKGSLMPHFLP